MSSQIDTAKIQKDIAQIIEKVRTDVDLELLAYYRSLFKGNVSFFRRSWVAAYLLMLHEQGRPSDQTHTRKSYHHGDEPNQYPLAEEDSVKLFISVGRNRRVFPREILGLITNICHLPREDVGAIRILDNYSFVQIRATAAEAVIAVLNGRDFRGRTLTVNYARSRHETEEDHDEAGTGENAQWPRGGEQPVEEEPPRSEDTPGLEEKDDRRGEENI